MDKPNNIDKDLIPYVARRQRSGVSGLPKSQKIVFFDILIIVIISAVLYPFLLQRERQGTLKNFNFHLQRFTEGEQNLYSLKIEQKSDYTETKGLILIDVTLDKEPYKSFKIPFNKVVQDEPLYIRFSAKRGESPKNIQIEIKIDKESIILNAKTKTM